MNSIEVTLNDKQVNPNWQFVGRLQEVSVFNDKTEVFSWIKTDTSAFAVKGFLKEPVHTGQAVKLSKKDNSVKIGHQLIERV